MSDTAMAAAFRKAGVERDVLYLAAVEALKRSDRNIERAVALLREAVVMAARDMKFGSNADGGPCDSANSGRIGCAADTSRGEGQSLRANIGQNRRAPSRDTVAQRAAKLRVAAVTVSAFSDFKSRYGLDLRHVQKHELMKLAKKHGVIARVAQAIERHAPNADAFAYVHEIIKDKDLELFIRQAEAKNDE